MTDALSHVTDFTYNGNGLLATKVTHPSGGVNLTTTFDYDSDGNLDSILDPLGHETTAVYNDLGQITSVTDDLSHTASFTYDAWGRQLTVTTSAGTTTYGYDLNSNLTSVTDGNSHATTMTYDNADRMLTRTKANGDVVTWAYDATGKKGLLSSKTNGNGRTTSYTYTTRNQMASATYPVSSGVNTSESWTYNAAGAMATHVDGKSQTKTYVYDNASRLIEIDYPGGTDTEFVYDDANRLTSMTDSTGTTGYTYDNADRLTQVASPNGTISYGYDNADRRTTLTISGSPNLVYTYTYDSADRLTSIENPYSETTTFTYDEANRLTEQVFANTSKAQYAYDSANRVTDLWHKKNDNTVLEHLEYGYDSASNVTSLTHTDASVTSYGYDDANQLTSESKTGANSYSLTYTYDDNGNRATKVIGGVTTTYSYDWQDRLTSFTVGGVTKSYTYDNNGNCTAVTVGGQTTSLTYDYENRVTGITYPSTATNAFTYNGVNLRASKVDSVGTFTYLCDGSSPASPVLSDGAAVYTPGISERRSGTSKYYHGDMLGSTKAITGSTQTVTDTVLYGAFGEIVNRTGTTPTPFGFVGEWQYQEDGDSSLQLLGHRYYDGSVGRFLSKDPAKDGDNWYAYCENNPTAWVDPEGLRAKTFYGPPTGNADTERGQPPVPIPDPPSTPDPKPKPGKGDKDSYKPGSGFGVDLSTYIGSDGSAGVSGYGGYTFDKLPGKPSVGFYLDSLLYKNDLYLGGKIIWNHWYFKFKHGLGDKSKDKMLMGYGHKNDRWSFEADLSRGTFMVLYSLFSTK